MATRLPRSVASDHHRILVRDPPIAQFLFSDTRASRLWLLARLQVGWEFVEAGWHKATDPAWTNGSGQGILAIWQRAVAVPAPPVKPLITYDWYRTFLQFLIDSNAAPWFSWVILLGDLAVGLGLITGTLVGLAAAGGILMNLAFLLAGTTSTNPLLLTIGSLLILAWKNAGYLGLDRWLLPLLGTPWQRVPSATGAAPRARSPIGGPKPSTPPMA